MDECYEYKKINCFFLIKEKALWRLNHFFDEKNPFLGLRERAPREAGILSLKP